MSIQQKKRYEIELHTISNGTVKLYNHYRKIIRKNVLMKNGYNTSDIILTRKVYL